MKLAWKELNFYKKKYLLVELILILLLFMVLFLSGMAQGLARAVASGIENMDVQYFLISDTAEDLITVSDLDSDILDQVKKETSSEVASLDIQRMYVEADGVEGKLNVTYFAIEPGSFMEPSVFEGSGLADAKTDNPIVLDDDFQAEGIELGDEVRDSASGLSFTVAGFTRDQMYGHVSVGFISTESYRALMAELNPVYSPRVHALAIRSGDIDGIDIEGTKILSKKEIVEHIPAYQAENLTITMIVWILLVISSIIVGVFHYILTVQKEKQYGVMKALGKGMWNIAGTIMSQVFMIAAFGIIAANIITFAMGSALPQTMPYYLTASNAVIVSVAFLAMSLIGSLLSVIRVAKVEPLQVIGGEQ